MIGDLYRSVLNEETLEMEPKAKITGVELVTQKKDFYGTVFRAGDPQGGLAGPCLTMLSPTISIGENYILLSGSVLVSTNYSVKEDWRFVPKLSAEK